MVPAGEVTGVWGELDRIERLAAGAKRLFAARVDAVGEWRNAGCANAAEFMALRSGVTIGVARTALETSRALDD